MSKPNKLTVKTRRSQRRTTRVRSVETLEPRYLMSADFRAIDGVGNNQLHPDWGSSDEAFLRAVAAEYADGISTPAGDARPNVRDISNLLAAHPGGELLNERHMSAFAWAWGQFLDHDIDLTPTTEDPAEPFPIDIPSGDLWFDPTGTGASVIPLTRSLFDPSTGTDTDNVRQQINRITAFIDGSQIYGSDGDTASSLRSLTGGRLKTSAGDLLPIDEGGRFYAGDIRVNENPGLTSLHTLFMREHNRLADEFSAAHPDWNDEKLYQEARRIVIAEIQVITYQEFLPALLGRGAIATYRGYDSTVNPGNSNEFATAAYRLGHSMVNSTFTFLDNTGQEVREAMPLREAFFNSGVLTETGIGPVLKYLASDLSEEVDTHVIDDLRNFLFGPPGSGGLDLVSLNIQRGRDHGLANYNATRVAFGLPAAAEFSDITQDRDVQQALREAYGTVDDIDLWIGGLAEDHVPGASVGATFHRILVDQFTRLRDGDRYFYLNDLSRKELRRVGGTTLAELIRRNSSITNVQDNVFFFHPTISGRVAVNGSADGHYTVHVISPEGVMLTHPVAVAVTSGNKIERVDVGVRGMAAPIDPPSKTPAARRSPWKPPMPNDHIRLLAADQVFTSIGRWAGRPILSGVAASF